MKRLMVRWSRRPSWFREIEVPLGIAVIAALVGVAFALFTGHHSPARQAISGHARPSWELVPGNDCWNDRAGVLRQLQKFHYTMDECAHNGGGSITEWWVRDGWPTAVLRQDQAGVPITLDSFYMPYAIADNESLIVTAGSRTVPAADTATAARALLTNTGRLYKLPAKADCTTDTYMARVSGESGGRTVWFYFSYSITDGGRTVTPSSCPLG